MTDKVPDHSTISWNRRIRFNDTDIFQEIFDEIVLQAISHRMVGERVLVTDSTHVKANANKHQYTKQLSNTKDYMNELNAAVAEDRKTNEKKS